MSKHWGDKQVFALQIKSMIEANLKTPELAQKPTG